MSTVNPYGHPGDFYVGLTTATVKDACVRCDATGTKLDGASVIVTAAGNWGFQCRSCTLVEEDARELNNLIKRLNRNPDLAAKVRKALGEE